MSEYELYHHGIGGMHWGIRRFQNEDGSLTPEGEVRYNQGKERASRAKAAEAYKTKKFKAKLALKSKKQKIKDAAEEARTLKKEESKLTKKVANMAEKKKVGEMSDEELRHEIDRLGMELDYNIKKYHAGKGVTMLDKVNAAIDTPLGQTITQLGVDVAKNAANRYVNNILDSRFDAEKVARTKKILTETIDSTRKTNADIGKVNAERDAIREKGKADVEKKNAERDKTISKMNEDRLSSQQARSNAQRESDENYSNLKKMNRYSQTEAREKAKTAKENQALKRAERQQEHAEQYGHDPSSAVYAKRHEFWEKEWQRKTNEAIMKDAERRGNPELSKKQIETARVQRELAQEELDRQAARERAMYETQQKQKRLNSAAKTKNKINLDTHNQNQARKNASQKQALSLQRKSFKATGDSGFKITTKLQNSNNGNILTSIKKEPSVLNTGSSKVDDIIKSSNLLIADGDWSMDKIKKYT